MYLNFQEKDVMSLKTTQRNKYCRQVQQLELLCILQTTSQLAADTAADETQHFILVREESIIEDQISAAKAESNRLDQLCQKNASVLLDLSDTLEDDVSTLQNRIDFRAQLDCTKKTAERNLRQNQQHRMTLQREYDQLMGKEIPYVSAQVASASDDAQDPNTLRKYLQMVSTPHHMRDIFLNYLCQAAKNVSSLESDVMHKTATAAMTLAALSNGIDRRSYLNEQLEHYSRRLTECKSAAHREQIQLNQYDHTTMEEASTELVKCRTNLRAVTADYRRARKALHVPEVLGNSTYAEDDMGYVIDIIYLTEPLQGQSMLDTYSAALHALLAHSLSVRVCRTSQTAIQIIEDAQHSSAQQAHADTIRIWPLDRIQIDDTANCFARHVAYSKILLKYQQYVKDPQELIGVAGESTRPILARLLGNWIFTTTDEIAAEIIAGEEFNTLPHAGCISLEGNRHSIGTLVVGPSIEDSRSRCPVHPFASQFRQYMHLSDSLRNLVQREITLADTIKRETLSQELFTSQQKCLSAISDITVELDELEVSIAQNQQALTDANSYLDLARRMLEKAEEHQQQMRSSLTAADSSLGTGKSQRNVFTLFEQQLLQRQQMAADIARMISQLDLEIEKAKMELDMSESVADNEHSIKHLQDRVTESRIKTQDLLNQEKQLKKELEDLSATLSSLQTALERVQTQREDSSDRLESNTAQLMTKCNQLMAFVKKVSALRLFENSFLTLSELVPSNSLNQQPLQTRATTLKNGFDRLMECIMKEDSEFADAKRACQDAKLKLTETEDDLCRTTDNFNSLREQLKRLANKKISRQQIIESFTREDLGRKSLSSRAENDIDQDCDDECEADNDAEGEDSTTHCISSLLRSINEKKASLQSMKTSYEQVQFRVSFVATITVLILKNVTQWQASTSIEQLNQGTVNVDTMIKAVHSTVFNSVRKRFIHMLAQFIPDKQIDLAYEGDVAENETEPREETVRFICRDSELVAGSSAAIRYDADDDDNNNKPRAQTSTENPQPLCALSGGQQAALGTAYVLACALEKCMPTYLLDEIDAAFDEQNQAVVGNLLASNFSSRQVLCVSHHTALQQRAHSVIIVTNKDGLCEIQLLRTAQQ
jgi:chromosome segregation ATPase